MNESNQPGLTPGQKVGLGRYTLLRELGAGGMGVVWLAEDEQLRENVALKFVSPEVQADKEAVDNLRRETASAHKLSHPNIIRIHDFQHPSGELPFISMEYIEGKTMADLRHEQPDGVYRWDELASFAKQLCDALGYAHDKGIIHRDLKPANLMVDKDGTLKLADFGISAVKVRKAEDSEETPHQRHTSGTLCYMSVQQLKGEEPQASDDIYALGVSLYHLLTSRPPFYKGSLAYQIHHEPADPIPQRLAELEISNEIPEHVSATIMACLGKTREERPGSAQEVWNSLWPAAKLEVAPEATAEKTEVPPEEKPTLWYHYFSRRTIILIGLLVLAASGWWLVDIFFPQHAMESSGDSARVRMLKSAADKRVKIAVEAADKKLDQERQARQQAEQSLAKERKQFEEEQTRIQLMPAMQSASAQLLQNSQSKRAAATSSPPDTNQNSPGANTVVPLTLTEGQPFNVDLGNNLKIELIWIPQGAFQMGKPGHKVKLSKGFWLGKYEVTQWQYAFITATNPSQFAEVGLNAPVENVSWQEAMVFCKELTAQARELRRIPANMAFRLPTEAQWEYACSAGNQMQTTKNWEQSSRDGIRSLLKTTPVGGRIPNTWELHDMLSSVKEWCLDWYDDYPTGEVVEPTGPDTGSAKVNRGGSVTGRYRDDPQVKSRDLGFRIALINDTPMSAALAGNLIAGLKSKKAQDDSALCLKQLKEIGNAFKLYAADNGSQLPTDINGRDGGSMMGYSAGSMAAAHSSAQTFKAMSRELGRTKILICPNDGDRVPAPSFQVLKAQNVSYEVQQGFMVRYGNSRQVLVRCPKHGHEVFCDGSARSGNQD